MANIIDESEGVIVGLILLAVLVFLILIALNWQKPKPNTATPTPLADAAVEDLPLGSKTLGAIQDRLWGPNYVPPSSGSPSQRISQTLWGNGSGNWVDQFFSALNKLLGGSAVPIAPQGDQAAASQAASVSVYGAAPENLGEALSFEGFSQGPPA